MNKIIIIGTTPPCPRCKLLTEIVKMKKKLLELDVDVRHISYTSDEAADVARKIGMTPGTAKEVAKLIGEEINIANMPKSIESKDMDFINNIDPNLKQFEKQFREVSILDNWLRPFERKAKNVGVLMTPVLIIDDEIKHSGSLPDLELIDKWLSETD